MIPQFDLVLPSLCFIRIKRNVLSRKSQNDIFSMTPSRFLKMWDRKAKKNGEVAEATFALGKAHDNMLCFTELPSSLNEPKSRNPDVLNAHYSVQGSTNVPPAWRRRVMNI